MLRLILKRSALLMTGTVGSAALSFVQSIFVTRALAPEQMGTWAISGSLVMVTYGLTGFRSVDAISRTLVHLSANRRDLRAAVITSALAAEFAAATVALVLLLLGAPWLLPHLSNSADALAVTYLLAISTFLLWVDRPFQALCRTTGIFRRITEITLLSGAVKVLATAVLFALGELTLVRFAVLHLAVSVLTFAAQGVNCSQLMGHHLSIGFRDISVVQAWKRRRDLAAFWRLMFASFWSSCCSSMFKQADVILLGVWRGDADAGLYRVAKNLATLCQAAGSSLAFSIFVEINALLAKRAYDKLWREIRRAVLLLLPLAVIVNVGGIAMQWLVPLMFGHQYAAAASLLQVQLVGVTFGLVLFWGFPLLIALEGEWCYLSIIAVGMTGQFALSYLFLPGGEGAMPMAIIYSVCWGGLHTALAVFCVRRVQAQRRITGMEAG